VGGVEGSSYSKWIGRNKRYRVGGRWKQFCKASSAVLIITDAARQQQLQSGKQRKRNKLQHKTSSGNNKNAPTSAPKVDKYAKTKKNRKKGKFQEAVLKRVRVLPLIPFMLRIYFLNNIKITFKSGARTQTSSFTRKLELFFCCNCMS